MKYLMITLAIFLSSETADAQSTSISLLSKTWGEVSDRFPVHIGKNGLILLELKNDKTFSAYINSDYGASILQSGNWKLKKDNIIFKVTKTKQGSEGKKYFMSGKLFPGQTGETKYRIVKSDSNSLILTNEKTNLTMTFKETNLPYFPSTR